MVEPRNLLPDDQPLLVADNLGKNYGRLIACRDVSFALYPGEVLAIVVTHDLAVARLLSHRVMVMKGGRVIETGLTDQVLDDPREPYTQLLVSSILPA